MVLVLALLCLATRWLKFLLGNYRALPLIRVAFRFSRLQNMFFDKGLVLLHPVQHDDALEAARQMGAVATDGS